MSRDANMATAPRGIDVRIPIEELAKYAGITALVSAVLAVAGVVATAAYLSAWGIPGPVIRLDPMTAALRSEIVVYQFALLGGLVVGLTWLRRRLLHRRHLGRVAVGLAIAIVAALVLPLVATGAIGPATALAGGVVLFGVHERRWLSTRGVAVAFAAIAIFAAFTTGAENGVLVRDDAAYRTPVVVATRWPASLPGGLETGGGWRYDDLYLVFRDGESVYVSRDGAGTRVWIIPTGNLMSLELGAAR